MPSIGQRFASALRAFSSVAPIDTSFFTHWGMPSLFKPKESLEAYDDNAWLYRAVFSIANEAAGVKYRLMTEDKDGEVEYIRSHQALETLKKPQPTKGGKSMITNMDLKMVTFMHMLLNGEAFWLLNNRLKINGSPTFIQPLLPQHMRVRVADTGDVLEYVYDTGNKQTVLDPMDVVHFKNPDPGNFYRGHSPVQSIRYALQTSEKADQMNASKLENYSTPAGILESDRDAPEAERRRILNEWKQYYGGPKNAGKTAVLPYGLKFNKIQESNKDMEYTQGKILSRDEILANFGIGLEIMGKTESQTRANAESAIFSFTRFSVLPYVKKFADTLSNDYLPAFPGAEDLEFTFDDPVPENMEEKRLNAQTGFMLGAMSPNEVRQSLGLEPSDQPGMDDFYLDLSKMPVGSAPPSLLP